MKRSRSEIDDDSLYKFRTGTHFSNSFLLFLASKHLKDCIPVLEHDNNDPDIIEYNFMKGKMVEDKDNDTSHMNNKMFVIPSSKSVIFKKKLEDEFFNCLNSKARHILLLLHIVSDRDDVSGHANILLLDTAMKTVERFEPHGWRFKENQSKMVDETLNNYFRSIEYIYLAPREVCPIMKVGPQSFAEYEQTLDKKREFCQSWSLWYADHRLTYPDVTLKELTEIMVTRWKEDKTSLLTFIMNFTEFVHRNEKRIKNPKFMKELSKEYTEIMKWSK